MLKFSCFFFNYTIYNIYNIIKISSNIKNIHQYYPFKNLFLFLFSIFIFQFVEMKRGYKLLYNYWTSWQVLFLYLQKSWQLFLISLRAPILEFNTCWDQFLMSLCYFLYTWRMSPFFFIMIVMRICLDFTLSIAFFISNLSFSIQCYIILYMCGYFEKSNYCHAYLIFQSWWAFGQVAVFGWFQIWDFPAWFSNYKTQRICMFSVEFVMMVGLEDWKSSQNIVYFFVECIISWTQ